MSKRDYETVTAAAKSAWDLLESGLDQACLVEAAAGGAVEGLCRDFLTAMNTHNTPASQVRVVMDGVRIPPYHYSSRKLLKVVHPDVVDRQALNRYFERGATVMLDDAQAAIPLMGEMCADLTEHAKVPTAATVFASPPHAEGFALHQDAEDVVIVQLAGVKRWTLFPVIERRDSSMLNRAECGEPTLDIQLAAGDILVVPRGAPHKTVSESSQGSVHVTLGFYPVTLREVLARLIAICAIGGLDEPLPATRQAIVDVIGELASEIPDDPSLLRNPLLTKLEGDTHQFKLAVSNRHTDGGSYRLSTQVTEATYLFLAAQLGRPDDQDLKRIVSALGEWNPGLVFSQREFASLAEDGILVQEVLHAMLRMRFITQVN